jgi:hypothetical protein
MRRSSTLPGDVNQRAFEIVRLSTEEVTAKIKKSAISEYLANIGRKGGLKGGKARAEALSARKRKEIARKAAITRWSKEKRILGNLGK